MILKHNFKLCRNCDGATNNQSKNLREWENERDSRHKPLPYSIHNDSTNAKSNLFYVFEALPNALDLMFANDLYFFFCLLPMLINEVAMRS